MKSEIIVAEFGSRREIGRWSVLPYPFVRRIQHPEIAKAGTNLIIVRKIIPRALTVRVELSVQLPHFMRGGSSRDVLFKWSPILFVVTLECKGTTYGFHQSLLIHRVKES